MQNSSIEMAKETIEGYQLSPQQKYLWLLQQIDHSLPYRVQCAVLIEGSLNIENLKTALEKVVNRHEILRTTFKSLPGLTIPLQVIGEGNISWGCGHNLSNLTLQEQEAKVEALFQELSQLPFNLEQGSVLHISLVILSPHKHIMLISLPALCADTVGMKNLVGEISRSYAAVLQGKESDEPLQYADIAEWQNELLEAEDRETARNYWRKQDISAMLSTLR